MANSLGKPCIVLAQADDSSYRGSGRGIQGLNLVDALSQCQELLTHWGGHPVAVGLSLQTENLEPFTKAFVESIEQNELRPELLAELAQLAPFGQENPEPILALKGVQLAQAPRMVGSGAHFQFSVFNGSSQIAGIAWKMGDRVPPNHTDLDLAFRLRWNNWNGRKNLQMDLQDWKISS